MSGTVESVGPLLFVHGFRDPLELWTGLRDYFAARRPVKIGTPPRSATKYPETTVFEVAQVAGHLDQEFRRERYREFGIAAALKKWRDWYAGFKAFAATATPSATYPANEEFWLSIAKRVAIRMSTAEVFEVTASGVAGAAGDVVGGAAREVKDAAQNAGDFAWKHKRWLWPVPGSTTLLDLAAGDTPSISDIPGLDLITGIGGGLKRAANAVFDGLSTPLLVGAAVLGGVLILPPLIGRR
jgi:hypothetical protein